MNPDPHEHDAALARLLSETGGEYAAVYRRLARAQPPRRLDRAVLGAAARAARGQEARGQRWWTWLGSAAGLVLAAGIAWRIGNEPLLAPRPQGAHDHAIQVEPITAPRAGHRQATPLDTAPARADARESAGHPPTSIDVDAPPRAATAPAKARQAQDATNTADPVEFGSRIAVIRQLLREGERAQAVAQLQALHAAYPAAPLPADLAALLDTADRAADQR